MFASNPLVQTDATNHTNDQRNYFKTKGNDKIGTNIRLITITYHDGNTPTTIKYNKLHTNTPITKKKQHLENKSSGKLSEVNSIQEIGN